MNQRDDLDGLLTAWLDDPYTPPAPGYLDAVLERTRRTRQRRAWASLERWLPMAVITPRPAVARPLRMAWILLIALLVLAFAAGVAIVGSRLLPSALVLPQGGAAVFAYDSHGDIFTVRADGTDVRQLTTGPDSELAPSWSPDGTRIAYRVWQAGSDSVVVMDAGGGNRTTLATVGQTAQVCVPYALAAWSPDGTMLAYPVSAGCSDNGPYDLFIVAADGSSPATRLLAPGLNSNSAAWSPDGTQIAFQGRDATGSPGLYVVDVGSGDAKEGGLQARRITDPGTYSDGSWTGPKWSPDGTEVAAAAGTNGDCVDPVGTFDALVVKADGSGQRALAAESAKEYNPTWSPDGRQLAFQRLVERSEWVNDRPCTVALWVADADGTNLRRLDGLGPDPAQAPLWSPDGTRLVGALNESPPMLSLYFVTVDGSSPPVKVGVNDDFLSGTWQPLAPGR